MTQHRTRSAFYPNAIPIYINEREILFLLYDKKCIFLTQHRLFVVTLGINRAMLCLYTLDAEML
jgi:hypothetical protein